MGIYDRDYYRKSGPSYLDAMRLSGSACKWLIIVNVVVYVLQFLSRSMLHPEGLVQDYFVLNPDKVLHGELWRLLTYAFLHDMASVWHIVFNMLFLWWFGSDVEIIYGTKEFVAFYLVSALLGGIAFTAWAFAEGQFALCLGASGAVTAVMVVCACHFPRKMILVFFVLPVPIWIFVLFQVGQDALAFLSHRQSGTAVQVHLAGAAFGFVYYKTQWRLTSLLPSLRSWRLHQRRPKLRVVRPDGEVAEAVHVGAPPAATLDEQLEAKVDAVLEKVARTGQASLTAGEREILLRASELYKRRRT
jgi:membrane associated rhomboid family serine protease